MRLQMKTRISPSKKMDELYIQNRCASREPGVKILLGKLVYLKSNNTKPDTPHSHNDIGHKGLTLMPFVKSFCKLGIGGSLKSECVYPLKKTKTKNGSWRT